MRERGSDEIEGDEKKREGTEGEGRGGGESGERQRETKKRVSSGADSKRRKAERGLTLSRPSQAGAPHPRDGGARVGLAAPQRPSQPPPEKRGDPQAGRE